MSEELITEIRVTAIEWGKKIVGYGDPDYYIPYTLGLKGLDEILKLIDTYREAKE